MQERREDCNDSAAGAQRTDGCAHADAFTGAWRSAESRCNNAGNRRRSFKLGGRGCKLLDDAHAFVAERVQARREKVSSTAKRKPAPERAGFFFALAAQAI